MLILPERMVDGFEVQRTDLSMTGSTSQGVSRTALTPGTVVHLDPPMLSNLPFLLITRTRTHAMRDEFEWEGRLATSPDFGLEGPVTDEDCEKLAEAMMAVLNG